MGRDGYFEVIEVVGGAVARSKHSITPYEEWYPFALPLTQWISDVLHRFRVLQSTINAVRGASLIKSQKGRDNETQHLDFALAVSPKGRLGRRRHAGGRQRILFSPKFSGMVRRVQSCHSADSQRQP
jgi:hypothetical protein